MLNHFDTKVFAGCATIATKHTFFFVNAGFSVDQGQGPLVTAAHAFPTAGAPVTDMQTFGSTGDSCLQIFGNHIAIEFFNIIQHFANRLNPNRNGIQIGIT